MKQIFWKAASWFGKWRRGQNPEQSIIGASRSGLWVVNPKEAEKGQISLAPWKSILAVTAFSRGEGTDTQVCLRIETNRGSLQLNEDMENWAEALAAMETRLADFPKTNLWLMDVAYPIDGSGETQLWMRSEAKQAFSGGSRAALRAFPAPQRV